MALEHTKQTAYVGTHAQHDHSTYTQTHTVTLNITRYGPTFPRTGLKMPGSTSEQQQLTTLQTSLSACSGAAITSLFMTPFDVVKTRLQLSGSQEACAYCSSAPGSRVLKLVRHEGVRTLWSGLQPTLLMQVPGTVLYFSAYEAARDGVAAHSPTPLRDYAPLVAGGGARLVTSCAVSPLELMRTRMQAEQALLRQGMLGGAVALVRREGVVALWKGLAPTLWRDVPFSMLYWLGYEHLKARAAEAHPEGQVTSSAAFVSGGTAGAVAALLTTPLDVVKTRRQVESGGGGGARGTAEMLAHIARAEGPLALLAGVLPRLAKVAPSCAIMIASYETGKRHFASLPRAG